MSTIIRIGPFPQIAIYYRLVQRPDPEAEYLEARYMERQKLRLSRTLVLGRDGELIALGKALGEAAWRSVWTEEVRVVDLTC